MGKNFSANNLGQRKASDFYETPYSITQSLLDAEGFDRGARTLEPACGDGAITRVLAASGFSDIVGYDAETDFLREESTFPQIITNPPFSLALDFILKAKSVARNKFAMLLPLSYLHGKERLDKVYSDREFPLACVHVFCRYPMLGDPLRDDGKYRTGMMVYAWFVWDKHHVGDPNVKWIDNQPFVLSLKSANDNNPKCVERAIIDANTNRKGSGK
ncbi:methyltransferase [Xanthomonas phage Kintu]